RGGGAAAGAAPRRAPGLPGQGRRRRAPDPGAPLRRQSGRLPDLSRSGPHRPGELRDPEADQAAAARLHRPAPDGSDMSDDDLLARALENELTPEEEAALAGRLKTDPALARRMIE